MDDDGVLAGPPLSASNALNIIRDIPGLYLNPSKCELFNRCNDFKLFPPEMKTSTCPNLDILGSPIGDAQYCSSYIASKRSAASNLSGIEKVALQDPHVLLYCYVVRMCGSFSKLSHIAHTPPPTIVTDELGFFDQDVVNCLSECLAIEMPPKAREQAQLSLRHGGLGFRSFAHHCSAACIASVSSTGSPIDTNTNLLHALTAYNAKVISNYALSIEEVVDHPHRQQLLSSKLEAAVFNQLIDNSSAADKARLMSVSSAHTSSWLLATPSPGLGLHLDPEEIQMAIKWWLGMDASSGSRCAMCPHNTLVTMSPQHA